MSSAKAETRLGADVTTPAAASSALLLILSTVFTSAISYVLNITLAWMLSVEHYGQLVVSQTIIYLLVWLLGAGFPWLAARAVALAGGAGPRDEPASASAWRTYKTAWLANSLLTFLLVGLLLLAYHRHWLPLGRSYLPLISIAALAITVLGLGTVPSAGLQGLFRFGRMALVRTIEAMANLIMSLWLVLLGFGAVGALAGFALAAALSATLNSWSMRDTPFWRVKGWASLTTILPALPMLVTFLGSTLLTNIDVLAVKLLSNVAESDSLAGTYQVAAVLSRAPLFISTALISAFFPHIVQDSRQQQDSDRSNSALMHWLIVLVLPINVVMAAGAPAVIALFFPQHYSTAGSILALLSLATGCSAFATALSAGLQALGRPKAPAAVMAGAVGIQVAGLLLLVPAWSTQGAAWASLAASTAACLVLFIYAKRADVALAVGRPRSFIALGLLALLIAPLSLELLPLSRLAIGLWFVSAGIVYAGICLVLHVVDVHDLIASPLLRHRAIAPVVRPVLTLALKLSRFGQRFERLPS